MQGPKSILAYSVSFLVLSLLFLSNAGLACGQTPVSSTGNLKVETNPTGLSEPESRAASSEASAKDSEGSVTKAATDSAKSDTVPSEVKPEPPKGQPATS